MMGSGFDPPSETFQGLGEAFDAHPRETFDEFARRLQTLVFLAAESYALRQGRLGGLPEIEALTAEVFADFAAEFGAGRATSLLRRFAATIRRILDDRAFEVVAFRYYMQLPIYELRDVEQRSLMAAAYESDIGEGTIDGLARRFALPRKRVATILAAGHEAVRTVLEKEFSREFLAEETEGYLS